MQVLRRKCRKTRRVIISNKIFRQESKAVQVHICNRKTQWNNHIICMENDRTVKINQQIIRTNKYWKIKGRIVLKNKFQAYLDREDSLHAHTNRNRHVNSAVC